MEGVDPRPSLEALAEAREKRIIRYAGVSNFSPRQLRSAHSFIPLDACQFPYNLIWRNPETGLIPLCGELGYCPRRLRRSCPGFSYGQISAGEPVSPRRSPGENSILCRKKMPGPWWRGLKKLKGLCDAYNTALPVAALQWIVSRGAHRKTV